MSLQFWSPPAASDGTVQGVPGAGLGMAVVAGPSVLGKALGREGLMFLCLARMRGCTGVECSSSNALFEPFKEIKEELEDLNKEIKKTANRIRGKLKGKSAF